MKFQSRLREVCEHLYNDYCYYRKPKSYFVKSIGQEYTDMLVKKGYLIDSPKINNINDFKESCYEFSKGFRLIFNYHTCTLWEFIKYYIIFDTYITIKDKLFK